MNVPMPPFPLSGYKIISNRNLDGLNEAVTDLLREGWTIWGMPYNKSGGQWTYQCMIKPEQPQGVYHGNPDHFGEGMFRV